MRASRNANTASALAINSSNLADSAMRRTRLLDAFQQLDEDDQADLLEAAEEAYWNTPVSVASEPHAELRRTFNLVYIIAGWGEFK
jgi:hypothetical protein